MPHRRTDVIATVWCRVSWCRWGQRIMYHWYFVCWVGCFATGHVGALFEGKKSFVRAFSAWAVIALRAVWAPPQVGAWQSRALRGPWAKGRPPPCRGQPG